MPTVTGWDTVQDKIKKLLKIWSPPRLSLTQLCGFWVNLVDDNICLQCLKGLAKYPKPWTAREELHTMGIDQHGWNLRRSLPSPSFLEETFTGLIPWGPFAGDYCGEVSCAQRKVLSIWVVLGKLPNFKIQTLWGIFIWTKWNEIMKNYLSPCLQIAINGSHVLVCYFFLARNLSSFDKLRFCIEISSLVLICRILFFLSTPLFLIFLIFLKHDVLRLCYNWWYVSWIRTGFFQGICVIFPAPLSSSSQSPVTPSPGDPVPS